MESDSDCGAPERQWPICPMYNFGLRMSYGDCKNNIALYFYYRYRATLC